MHFEKRTFRTAWGVTVDAGGWVCSCGDREIMEGVCVLGVAAVIFLLAAAFRVMFRAMPFSFLAV